MTYLMPFWTENNVSRPALISVPGPGKVARIRQVVPFRGAVSVGSHPPVSLLEEAQRWR